MDGTPGWYIDSHHSFETGNPNGTFNQQMYQRLKEKYKTCQCADYYMYAWRVPFKYLEAFAMVDKYHDENCKKHHKGNGKYTGPFAFTLTKSPKDALTVGDMLTAVRKVMKQKSQPIIKYAWYYEDKGRDDNGDAIHPHIHGMYETADGRRLETKHWQRAWSIWNPKEPIGAGFRGGYHREVKLQENYSDYIAKDGGMSESTDNF